MIYVMADLHGEYGKYRAMLEQIGFGAEDTLYILGDVVDRGPHPMRILQDMARRPNVIPILGNHDAMARVLLRKLMVEVTAENCETYIDMTLMRQIMDWQMNGSRSTMAEFRALSMFGKLDMLDYLDGFRLYAQVDIGERRFILVHAGLSGFDASRPMDSYTADELIFDRHDMDRVYFGDGRTLIVTGHTPTLALSGKAEILRRGESICIDCGAAFPGGRLACLRLDDMVEFYV
ncbi:MAG: fructose-bisphosphatase class III [Clostridia bacterium]|nr:fructose-bisphosphatase class III [Clostridia bacterium]